MAKERVHTSEQITAFLDELKSQTDRGAAVIAAAVLDELFQMLLLARLTQIGNERKEALFDKIGAPLSSFSAKIELAFALGIISNEARLAAHLIRDVRNKFAHRIEQLTFDHSEVTELLQKRAPPSVKAMEVSVRDQFLTLFQGLAVVLYGTLGADIRIKSIEETHAAHTLGIILEALRASAGLATPESAVSMMAHRLDTPMPE